MGSRVMKKFFKLDAPSWHYISGNMSQPRANPESASLVGSCKAAFHKIYVVRGPSFRWEGVEKGRRSGSD